MAFLFDAFWFEPGARMTGLWVAGGAAGVAGADVVVSGHLVALAEDQDPVVEASFLGAHLPFHFGGFHGLGPSGSPWVLMLQAADMRAAEVAGAVDPWWPLVDGMSRALQFNGEAQVLEAQFWSVEDLRLLYGDLDIADWTAGEVLQGLLAQCCNVPLSQIVAGRTVQCAFPEVQHDCQRDVFHDVFSMWTTSALNPPEPTQ